MFFSDVPAGFICRHHASPITGKTKMVTVEGTVVDETETPVIGANVYIKGSTKGVSTNVDGNFILQEYLSDRLSLSLSLVTKIIRCGLQKGERN